MAGLTQFTNAGLQEVSHFLIVFPSTWICFQESMPTGIQVSDITQLLSPWLPIPKRSSFTPVMPTLINSLSLRMSVDSVFKPCLGTGNPCPGWEPVSEQSRATQSQCFCFSQMYPSLTFSLQVRGKSHIKGPPLQLSQHIHLDLDLQKIKQEALLSRNFYFLLCTILKQGHPKDRATFLE